jgi:DNA adenine methylase
VPGVLLADANPLVAAFWQVAAAEPQALIDRMRDEHATHIAAGAAAAVNRRADRRAWTPRSTSSGPEAAMTDTTLDLQYWSICMP